MTPSPSTSVASKNVVGDESEDADTPEVSRPPSTSVADSGSKEDEDEFRYHLARREMIHLLPEWDGRKGKGLRPLSFC